MIESFAQVGESFFERNLNPAPDVDVSMEAVEDVDGKDHADEGEGEDSVDEGAADDGGGTAAMLSDSMVPLVGDSILQVKSKLQGFLRNRLSLLLFSGQRIYISELISSRMNRKFQRSWNRLFGASRVRLAWFI